MAGLGAKDRIRAEKARVNRPWSSKQRYRAHRGVDATLSTPRGSAQQLIRDPVHIGFEPMIPHVRVLGGLNHHMFIHGKPISSQTGFANQQSRQIQRVRSRVSHPKFDGSGDSASRFFDIRLFWLGLAICLLRRRRNLRRGRSGMCHGAGFSLRMVGHIIPR